MGSPPGLHERASGVLLHPTSLPGPHGSGDLGAEARRFVDQLASASQRWWQMLPVAPPGYGSSPYSAESAFAGSPLLVSLGDLAEEGLLRRADLRAPRFARERVDHDAAWRFREPHLRAAFAALQKRGRTGMRRLESFREETRAWLEDYVLFRALKGAHQRQAWTRWDPALRDRRPPALRRARRELAGEIAFHEFEQWAFARQWSALRTHANERGVGLIGDVPIFVAHDSCDVWSHRELFQLDRRGEPTVVAGVPPDYFSTTGQRWGNPLYRWSALRRTGYGWWIDRLASTLARFDAVRLDHFIGFVRGWEVPGDAPTAQRGRWVKGPGAELFEAFRRALGAKKALPLIAEDLGAVTPAVKSLRDQFELPGIRVLQFAFGDDPSAPDFLPHNYPRRAVVYTGTHDNDTTVGWFRERGGKQSTRGVEQTEAERRAAKAYLPSDGAEIHWDMIRVALASVADTAIVPAQDLLGLGSDARMNLPGVGAGNWAWRMAPGALDRSIVTRLGDLTRTYGRAP